MPVTRSWSPWTWCCTPFSSRPLRNFPISRALSDEMPMLRVTLWRTVPFAASSTFPYETAFNDTCRRTSFSSSTCVRAFNRASLSVWRSIVLSLSSIEEPVFLKSKRVPTSRLCLVDRVADFLHVELRDHVERRHHRS